MPSDLYASGVRVYIDGQDISQYVFGASEMIIDINNNFFDDIDISLWVKTPGEHTFAVTVASGSLDVDSRFEIF